MKSLKPREKALQMGFSNVSDDELLAIMLGFGSKKRPVQKLAKSILSQQPLAIWNSLSPAHFQKIPGCGPVKSLQISACIELGRRIFVPPTSPVIRTGHDVFIHLSYLANRTREEVVCFYLNARNELLSKQTVAVGGLNYSSLHPRDVFAPALQLPCASVILSHNHPSGNAEPSQEDIRVTETLQAAGNLLGIVLLDHIIVAKDKHVSLAELGILERI
jgi:DNA repair protein RadC